MKKLVIAGKGHYDYTVRQLHNMGYEVWTVGTSGAKDCDRYYEFHNLPSQEPCFRDIPEEVKHMELPLNNSICIMLAIAKVEQYDEVLILGCEMRAKEEYIEQKPALAYIVGLFSGQGMKINWSDLPKNINYWSICNNNK